MWRARQEIPATVLAAFLDFSKAQSYRFKRTGSIAAGWMEGLPQRRSSGPYFEVGCHGVRVEC